MFIKLLAYISKKKYAILAVWFIFGVLVALAAAVSIGDAGPGGLVEQYPASKFFFIFSGLGIFVSLALLLIAPLIANLIGIGQTIQKYLDGKKM